PYGIKPFFHLVTDDGVYFASEKKALLPFAAAAQAGDAGVDGANLSHYLTLQYVPEPGTLQRGIGRIGSGEAFVYTPGGPPATRPPVLPAAVPAHAHGRPGSALQEDPRDAAGERPGAHAVGRAGGRVPVQRHRLDGRRGAGPGVQPEHPHVHRGVRRRRVLRG